MGTASGARPRAWGGSGGCAAAWDALRCGPVRRPRGAEAVRCGHGERRGAPSRAGGLSGPGAVRGARCPERPRCVPAAPRPAACPAASCARPRSLCQHLEPPRLRPAASRPWGARLAAPGAVRGLRPEPRERRRRRQQQQEEEERLWRGAGCCLMSLRCMVGNYARCNENNKAGSRAASKNTANAECLPGAFVCHLWVFALKAAGQRERSSAPPTSGDGELQPGSSLCSDKGSPQPAGTAGQHPLPHCAGWEAGAARAAPAEAPPSAAGRQQLPAVPTGAAHGVAEPSGALAALTVARHGDGGCDGGGGAGRAGNGEPSARLPVLGFFRFLQER